MKRTLYLSSLLLLFLLLAAGCRTRKGENSTTGQYGADSASNPGGYVNVDGTELANWSWEGGYNEQGQYVGAGGLFDSKGQYVGDTGGFDENGVFVGEKGYFNSKGEWMGPGGGYDENGVFVGLGGMYDKNGKYVGLTNPNAAADAPEQLFQANPNTPFRQDFSVGIQPIYFGFDQDNIPRSEYGSLDVVVQRLRASNEKVLLEGHCDERGSKAYNLGLGERRAQAVRTFLVGSGIAASRITTTSFGSEQPAAQGHNEAAWRLNRRVNFQFYQ